MKGPNVSKTDPRLRKEEWLILDYAICVTSCWVKEGKVYIEPLDPEVAEIEEAFEPIWTLYGRVGEPKFSGFRIADIRTDSILGLFEESQKAAARIGSKLAMCYFFGNPLPEPLKDLAVCILNDSVAQIV